MDKKADPKKKRQPRPAKKGAEECQCQNVQAAVAKALAAAKPKRRQPRRQPPKAPKQAAPVMLPLPRRVIEVPTYIPIPEESRVVRQTRVETQRAPTQRAKTQTLATQTDMDAVEDVIVAPSTVPPPAEQPSLLSRINRAVERFVEPTGPAAPIQPPARIMRAPRRPISLAESLRQKEAQPWSAEEAVGLVSDVAGNLAGSIAAPILIPKAGRQPEMSMEKMTNINFPFLDDDQGEDIAEQFYRNKQQKKGLEQMKKRTAETADQKELLGRVEKSKQMSLMEKGLGEMRDKAKTKKATREIAGSMFDEMVGEIAAEAIGEANAGKQRYGETREILGEKLAPVMMRRKNEPTEVASGILEDVLDDVVTSSEVRKAQDQERRSQFRGILGDVMEAVDKKKSLVRNKLVGDLAEDIEQMTEKIKEQPAASMEEAEEDAAAVRKVEIDQIKAERQPKINETLDKFNARINQKTPQKHLLRFYNAQNKTDFTSLPPSANVEALRDEFAAAYTDAMLDPEKKSPRYDIGQWIQNYTGKASRQKEREKNTYRESPRAPPVAVLRREEPAQTMIPIVAQQDTRAGGASPAFGEVIGETVDENVGVEDTRAGGVSPAFGAEDEA